MAKCMVEKEEITNASMSALFSTSSRSIPRQFEAAMKILQSGRYMK